MKYRVVIQDLGVVNDKTVISGDTPGDVWEQVRKYLDDNHDIEIPALGDVGGEAILPATPRFDNTAMAGQQGAVVAGQDRFASTKSSEANLVVTRLIEKLHIGKPTPPGSDTVPPGGTQSPVA